MTLFSTTRAGRRADVAARTVLSLDRRLTLAVTLPLAALILAMLAATAWLCGGHFIYSLDDPYISLSLGWHIAHGQYGINATEAASPSSSILYPLILAAFGWARWQQFVPLMLNAMAALATAIAFAAAFRRYGIVGRSEHIPRAAVLIVTLCLAINTIGLVFTGLEHSLHALTSVLVVFGLARAFEEDRAPAWLLPVIVLAPLWRFEGLALALLAIAGLAAIRQWRTALAALLGVAATIAAYMAAMHALGLPLLPSSVLAKSAVTDQAVEGALGPLGWAAFALHDAAQRLSWQALPMCLVIELVIAHPLLRAVQRRRPLRPGFSLYREMVFAGVTGGAVAAQVLFGADSPFARYEGYALAAGIAGAIVLWREELARLVSHISALPSAALALLLAAAGFHYLVATATRPLAAQEIYQQQYQMHRFAADFYRRPVAVNDIGWVGYRNPNYVLDLWGLGSEDMRRARARADPDRLDRLVAARHIGLAMIYDEWFAGQVPSGWRRLAVLHNATHIVAVSDKVSFYATSPAAIADATAALRAFSASLPAGSSLTIDDDDRPAAGAGSQ